LNEEETGLVDVGARRGRGQTQLELCTFYISKRTSAKDPHSHLEKKKIISNILFFPKLYRYEVLFFSIDVTK
jgi:hypothetical protein